MLDALPVAVDLHDRIGDHRTVERRGHRPGSDAAEKDGDDQPSRQGDVARTWNLTEENQRHRKERHLQPQRVLAERVNLALSDERRNGRVNSIDREREVNNM